MDAKTIVNRHGVTIMLVQAPINPGQWQIMPTPELEEYLKSTPRSQLDIPCVTMRTVDTLRKKLGISSRKNPKRWYMRYEAARVILGQSEPSAAKTLGMTEDEIDWAKRQLRKRGLLTVDDVELAAMRSARK